LPILGRVKEPFFLVSDTARAATSWMIPEAVFLDTYNFPAKMGHDLGLGDAFFGYFGISFAVEFKAR
jgi:hypothetical protein